MEDVKKVKIVKSSEMALVGSFNDFNFLNGFDDVPPPRAACSLTIAYR